MSRTCRGLVFLALVLILLVTSCRTGPYSRPPVQQISPPENPPLWIPTEYKGIVRLHYRDREQTLSFSVLRIDMSSGLYDLVLSEPDPSGKGEARSAKVSEFVRENRLIAGINAAPYGPKNYLNRRNFLCDIAGLFLYRGTLVSPPVPSYDALIQLKGGRLMISSQSILPENAYWAIGGFHIALENGKVSGRSDIRHPRSVVGLSPEGDLLYLAVFDGRQKEAAGVTTREIGLWMAWLGAHDALNMDGGGSSTLVLNENGESLLLNSPIHRGKPGLERSVASHIGLSLRKD